MICSLTMIAAVGCSSKGGGGGGGGDTTAPSVPTGLTSAVISASQISLAWGASTDDAGVTGYKVYRDGTYLKSATTTTALDSGLTSSTQYCYQVSAYDAAGNESNKSLQACATAITVATFKMPDTGQTQSYTNTFGEDHDYSINPPSYTDNGNGTITDNVTSLIWQKQDDGVAKTWADAITYCDNLTLGGQTDWRLPSRLELVSIVDYGTYSSSYINTTYFPGTIAPTYWSSIENANYALNAWAVWYGTTSQEILKTDALYARCVRGGQSIVLSLTDNGNDTVTDNTTHLIWHQHDSSTELSWEDAISYCEASTLAGYNDWRLPNIKELATIVSETSQAGIVTPFHINWSMNWSSTTNTSYTADAWTFYNSLGEIWSGYIKGQISGSALCVRGGQ
jgi:hypothetical protein